MKQPNRVNTNVLRTIYDSLFFETGILLMYGEAYIPRFRVITEVVFKIIALLDIRLPNVILEREPVHHPLRNK